MSLRIIVILNVCNSKQLPYILYKNVHTQRSKELAASKVTQSICTQYFSLSGPKYEPEKSKVKKQRHFYSKREQARLEPKISNFS
jgi:hypothetical protein